MKLFAFALFGAAAAIQLVAPCPGQSLYLANGAGGIGVSSSANVGIGTSNPAALLHVQTNDGSWVQGIFENLAAAAGGGGIQLRNNGTGPSGQGGVVMMGATQNPYTSYQKRLAIISYANGAAGTGSSGITFSMEGGSEGPQDLRVMNGSSLGNTIFIIKQSGNVGIGTTTPDQTLSVNGSIHTREVIVDNNGWSDFVFSQGYRMLPLAEVEAKIRADHHLPGMPSAEEVAHRGVEVGQMEAKLLQKVEELTLYTIELQKQNQAITARLAALEAKQ